MSDRVEYIITGLEAIHDHSSQIWDEVRTIWEYPDLVSNDELVELLTICNAVAAQVSEINSRVASVAVRKVRLFADLDGTDTERDGGAS